MFHSSNCRPWIVAALIALPSLFAAQAAQADVIYSNFGPGDSYDSGTSWLVDSSQQVAMPFTVGGGDHRFSSVEVAFNTGDVSNTQIHLLLMSDIGGLPGAILETLLVNVDAGSFITMGTSALQPTLLDGTKYWIATDSSITPGFSSGWAWTSPVVSGGFAFSVNAPPPWNTTNKTLGAFRVNGIPFAANEVPEPASIMLWSLVSAAGLAAWRRRRQVAVA